VLLLAFFLTFNIALSADPPSAGAPADGQPVDEWPELGPKAPRLAFDEMAFDDADGALRGISKNQLTRWLEPVPGQNHNFTEANRGNIFVAGFDGLVRLCAPWPPDAVLAMAPFDHHGLAIYFWHGTQGVSLHYYQHPRPTWAAYRVSRKGQEPRPATFALAATDNGRYDRSLAGAIEIRHQAGNLVVNRGDIRLVTVPLEGPPGEVYFERHAWLRSFAMYRSEPVPDDAVASAPDLFADTAPAKLEWTKQLAEGTRFEAVDAGGVQLSSDKGAATSWSAVRAPRAGLYEMIFRLGDASPGTGVYLGDNAGKPLHILGVLRDQRSGQNVVNFLKPDAGWFEIGVDLNQQPVPFIGPGQWLRLIAGSGTLTCRTSGDGVHWSRALDPARGLRGAWSTIGLVSFKTNDAHRITLEKLTLHELAAISALADAKLVQQVPDQVAGNDQNPAAWQARVDETRPAKVDIAAWKNACALRTLAAFPPAQLGNRLLDGLLEANLVRPAPAAERVQVINQAAEIYDAWDQPESYVLSQCYERLGKRLLSEGEREPWSKAGRALITAPIWTTAQYQTVPESLANPELLFRIYADEWKEVRQLCRRLRLFNRTAVPEQGWPDNRLRIRLLVEWASANAERALAEKPRRENGGAGPGTFYWQHPLMVSLSKEGYNTLADLEVALADQSYREACQVIVGVKPELALGLLPDGRDPRLLLSLPQAVDTAMRDYPGLRQTMIEQFGIAARLRLQQALAESSPHLLEALAVQFFGTAAAATAHQWLGDRALGDGDFARASAEFELALRSADRSQQPALTARLRLSGAMLGRDEGGPVKTPVVFNELRLAPEAFEKLVAEMKSHAVAVGGAPLVATESATQTGVKKVRYEVHGRGPLAGDVGQNSGNALSGNVDWAARQTGMTIAGKMLFLSNRFQVSCFSLVSGKQHWSVPMNKEQGPTHGWGLVAMQPLVVGDRLFVRRLARHGPELVCFNAVNGKVRWTTPNSVSVASDPLLLQDRMYVFTFGASFDDGQIALGLSLVNPLTGEMATQQPVMQVRNLWDKQVNCRAAVVGAKLVLVAGGTVLCSDFAGRPLWIRRQMWIPPAQAPAGHEQSTAAPLVLGNRVFVTQPGVFAIECLDLETGRRIWQEAVPGIRRLIGTTGERLIVETSSGWQAHAAATGQRLWQYEVPDLLDAHVCPPSGDLLLARRELVASGNWQCVLVWLDPETGRATARLPLEALADRQPLLGPMIVDRDRLWVLFGRGLGEPRRDVFELTPTGEQVQQVASP
jgi:outer membrane protein assembly factor BamB